MSPQPASAPDTPVGTAPIETGALGDWMDGQDLPGGAITGLRPIGGGTQNIMVRFERGGVSYVLRRGPRHLRPNTTTGITREMTLLSALSGTTVPHPRFVAGTDDESVLGAVFYLMEPVDGFNAAEQLDAPTAATAEGRTRMGYGLVDALAELGAVDHTRIGLGDFGRPEGFLQRQVPRWLAEFDRYRGTAGYPGPEFGELDRVADWLERYRPTDSRPGILHGDYHIANVMYRYDSPVVAAIVDWEMATIGDPLLDLGVLSAIWPTEPGGAELYESALGATGDLPRRAAMIDRYAAASERDLSALDWYTVLACFKLGIILEGTYARSCAGKAPRAVGERLRRYANGLFDRADRVIAGE